MSESELIEMIAEIDLAIKAALSNKSYELDTGQGKQKVTRQDLKQLTEIREYFAGQLRSSNGAGLLVIDNCSYK